MELVDDVRLLSSVSFVDCEEERTSGLAQQANQFKIWRADFSPAVDNHHNGGRFVERNPGLAEDFRWNEIFIFGNDPTSVDDADAAAAPFCVSVEAVARDAGLIADDGTTRAHDPVKQRGLAYVGSAHDG